MTVATIIALIAGWIATAFGMFRAGSSSRDRAAAAGRAKADANILATEKTTTAQVSAIEAKTAVERAQRPTPAEIRRELKEDDPWDDS